MTARHRLLAAFPALGSFISILLVGLISQPFVGAAMPLLVASMGASAVILFCLPDKPPGIALVVRGGALRLRYGGDFLRPLCARYRSGGGAGGGRVDSADAGA